MGVRAEVLQRVQIGVEAALTPGTLVAANRRLLGTRIRPVPSIDRRRILGAGVRAPSATAIGKEHTVAAIEGEAHYTDMLYLLCALVGTPTGTGTWTFELPKEGIKDPRTLTVEYGDGSTSERFGYGFIPDFQVRFTPTEVSVSGQMLGNELDEDATLTATPTRIPGKPISAKDWIFEVGPDTDNLVKLNRVLDVELVCRGLRRAGFFGDGEMSFKDTVDLAPNLAMNLNLVHDSVAVGFMEDLREAEQAVARITAVGAEFNDDPATNYELELTMPFVFGETGRPDQEGVRAASFVLEAEDIPDVSYILRAVLTNHLTEL